MMDWPGMQWDTQSDKDTANQSNADINNQIITLSVNPATEIIYYLRYVQVPGFRFCENDNFLRVCLSKHKMNL